LVLSENGVEREMQIKEGSRFFFSTYESSSELPEVTPVKRK
jgi:hypothetical protein